MSRADDAIYLDHAATCGTRPEEVATAILQCLSKASANPGRSGHRRSIAAAEIVFDARETVARLFGVEDERRLAFALNATDALNIAIRGLLDDCAGSNKRHGASVTPPVALTTPFEHNSVMRPLRALEADAAILVESMPTTPGGCVDTEALAERLARDDVATVVVNHASNVTGIVQPVAAIGAVCRANGVPLVVDAAQSAGVVDIDVTRDSIDILAFTGHKGLMGPQGTGGIFVREGVDLPPLRRGGTGSRSEEEHHPDFYPDRLEAGTPNTPGLAGLMAGVRFVGAIGVSHIAAHERALLQRFAQGLATIPRARLLGPPPGQDGVARVAVASVVVAGVLSSRLAYRLDREHSIFVRAGLHCAPAAHRTLGTHPDGAARFSFGYFNTAEEVDRTIDALATIVESEEHPRPVEPRLPIA